MSGMCSSYESHMTDFFFLATQHGLWDLNSPTKSELSAVKAQSPNQCTTRKYPLWTLKNGSLAVVSAIKTLTHQLLLTKIFFKELKFFPSELYCQLLGYHLSKFPTHTSLNT